MHLHEMVLQPTNNYISDLELHLIIRSHLLNFYEVKSKTVKKFPLHFQVYSINSDCSNEFKRLF